ncbi:glutamate-ammonia-ligase adenylyltransferase [Taylorella equigenitalis 14/56]|uniref:Bifunctional glutamine synthetase adenylyltransferase/adenylyl-removing enzyme n=1 Tax=Taylorella equigenitalis 14/56 TaxID=1091497 RepID=I7JND7_9BURK|nr:bifunctional [glutamate--ammonia ligase]-adenylyl-L-tyrosine phosphorylase/[glutamate--ammonia-ligase] adenylyltransferase [Taylorella equigenitalis]ASY30799.1 bifunctional glutamine synthetase adenylyltransferase/deadenyltransferase [Taylorella equigenitalis]KOS59417.1 glutamate-ammonia-ligase adenylyltransferase [Taylorella equigenitalis]WDU52973.1 bifunctional [glutamate--ammonia ligase]-adenylyl-L-tyrosine phosphorylase/[glutamate--ammonia-ligase] adenylyltransferase [Taylorella equigenit
MDIISNAANWSNYLKTKLSSSPKVLEQLNKDLDQEYGRSLIKSVFADVGLNLDSIESCDLEIDSVKSSLRLARRRILLVTIVKDIAKEIKTSQVVQTMSLLADFSIKTAYHTVNKKLSKIYGTPKDPEKKQPLLPIIIGMGKLGGFELNVSSDIDLVVLYSCQGETEGKHKSISFHEYFHKLTQRMMHLLSDIDADGFVFRTDLRLRPDGDGSPLAWSLNAFEHYIVTQGREWERYAYLKARAISITDIAIPNNNDYEYFEDLRTSFVYRKYFDFDTLNSLRDLREQIKDDWDRKVAAKSNNGFNIKLGDGGIREIEFIAQLIQLMKGGRLPSLQERGTVAALKAISAAGLMELEDATKLVEIYYFHRRVEHFLQYKDDMQTHEIPDSLETRKFLASAMGYEFNEFTETLEDYCKFVSKKFEEVFNLVGLQTEPVKEVITTLEKEESDKFSNLKQAWKILKNKPKIKQLSPTNIKRLDELFLYLADSSLKSNEPVRTFNLLCELIETIAQRSTYITLLIEYPEVIKRVARIMSTSRLAAQVLLTHPILLDSLLDWNALMEPIDFETLRENLNREMAACVDSKGNADVERQMNLIRDAFNIANLQLIAQDLENAFTVEELADNLSLLADILLEMCLRWCWGNLRKPDWPEEPEFAIIGYGKLGGKELGYYSDLDLVFIFDSVHPDASEMYSKLGRRLINWLTAMTSSGRLYEVDMRLRPDGDSGLLTVTMDSFKKYQLEDAWVWEHQALSRARFVAGSVKIGNEFEALRKEILKRNRDGIDIKGEILKMRERISQSHRPSQKGLFNVKYDVGGMIDIEFITQFLVLTNSHKYEKLILNLGNINLLQIASDLSLIPEDLASKCIVAYRTYRKIQHEFRLQEKSNVEVNPSTLSTEIQAVKDLYKYIFQ